jgi:hypothetical protein
MLRPAVADANCAKAGKTSGLDILVASVISLLSATRFFEPVFLALAYQCLRRAAQSTTRRKQRYCAALGEIPTGTPGPPLDLAAAGGQPFLQGRPKSGPNVAFFAYIEAVLRAL